MERGKEGKRAGESALSSSDLLQPKARPFSGRAEHKALSVPAPAIVLGGVECPEQPSDAGYLGLGEHRGISQAIVSGCGGCGADDSSDCWWWCDLFCCRFRCGTSFE
jgi:hypothetical protein